MHQRQHRTLLGNLSNNFEVNWMNSSHNIIYIYNIYCLTKLFCMGLSDQKKKVTWHVLQNSPVVEIYMTTPKGSQLRKHYKTKENIKCAAMEKQGKQERSG